MILDGDAFENKKAIPEDQRCSKDTGTRQTLRPHSRGILAMISGGGIIKHWTHFYKAESLSQV